jgi:hypothetical protein
MGLDRQINLGTEEELTALAGRIDFEELGGSSSAQQYVQSNADPFAVPSGSSTGITAFPGDLLQWESLLREY